ncbi:MAG: hypothetical protein ACNYZH_05245 [Acidimicrobiia bacterium]
MIQRTFVTIGLVLALLGVGMQSAEATWSVVAVDPETKVVGVAVAGYVGFDVTGVSMLVPGADQAVSSIAIGEADDGADTSTKKGRKVVPLLVGAIVAIGAVVAVLVKRSRERRRRN